MESQLLWFAAIGGLGIGLLLGVALARSRRGAARIRELEEELARAESAHAQYRTQVAQHFGETSRRLHDLTLQYRSVYEHLADGARSLCPEGSIAIAPSLAEAALPETAGAGDGSVDDAQLDLALDELGPILDEETPPPPVIDPARAS